MKVLVTGGAGFIGRWVVKKLLDSGHIVYVLDDLSNGSSANLEEFKDNVNFKGLTVGSVVDRDVVARLFADGLDVVAHLAAQINVQESIDNPEKAYLVNILGTYNILEEARKQNTKVVLMGTCMVYDIADAKKPISELHPIKPKSPYAGSKIGAESLAESYFHAFGLPVVILRPFNTYGPFQKSNMEGGVVSIFIKNYLEGKTLNIFGDGTQTRDLLYVEDCADFVVQAIEDNAAVGHVLNAGTGDDIMIKDLALLIAKDPSRIKFVTHHHPQAEIPKLVCDYSKAKKLLGWSPKVSLPEGIRRTSEWISSHLDKASSSEIIAPQAASCSRKKMLITGATGLLGPFLLEKFTKNFSVTAIGFESLPDKKFYSSDFKLINVDLTDSSTVTDLISSERPAVILHAAALTNLEFCESNPDVANNVSVGSTKNLIAACKAAGIKPHIVYVSTDYVFDGEKGNYSEHDKPSPINVYSKTKAFSEKVVLDSGLSSLIVRTAFYGWSKTPGKKTFSEWIVDNLRQGKKIHLTRDQHTSMMLIDDFVDVLSDLIQSNSKGVFHVGSERVSRYEFGLQIADVFGLSKALIKPVTYDELLAMLPKSDVLRPSDVSLDTSKVETYLGRRMPSVADSLRRLRDLENSRVL